MNEMYRLYRLYCQFSVEDVARVTKIRKNRLTEIETGKAEPTEVELEKLAALYNISLDRMKLGFNDNFTTIIKQPADASFYNSDSERDFVIMSITSLTEDEKNLIMMYRTSDNKDKKYKQIIDLFIEDEDIIIRD